MSGENKVLVVVDTNVLVSSLFSLDGLSNPAIIIRAILEGKIIPLYNDEILDEYRDVLSRPKFPFDNLIINTIVSAFRDFGIDTQKSKVPDEMFPDPDDIVFYEVKMSVDDAYLITGNIKHFPKNPLVVTPLQMVEVLRRKGLV